MSGDGRRAGGGVAGDYTDTRAQPWAVQLKLIQDVQTLRVRSWRISDTMPSHRLRERGLFSKVT